MKYKFGVETSVRLAPFKERSIKGIKPFIPNK